MIRANLVSTLMIKRSTIILGKDKNIEFDITNYQRLIEKLMYWSLTIRPDLEFNVSRLAKHIADLYLNYCRAAKRVLQYLKKTITLELEYDLNIKQDKASYSGSGLVSYANSDYINNTKSKQSTIGYVYCLSRAVVL